MQNSSGIPHKSSPELTCIMEHSVNVSTTFILRNTLARNSSTTCLKSSRLLVSNVSLKNLSQIKIARAILAFVAKGPGIKARGLVLRFYFKSGSSIHPLRIV
jgi:hypothetical protein